MCADPAGAGVGAVAEETVIAACSISSDWVAAYTCCRITDARRMALIEGGANYRCSWLANTVLAGIAEGAGIAIRAACAAQRCVNASTFSTWITVEINGIRCAGIVVVAIPDWRCARWDNALIIGLIAGLPHGTRGPAACADAVLASVGHCAEETVIAGCSIGSDWVAAYTCCRITDAHHMALIEGGANRRCSAAGPIGAYIICRAQIVVIAGCSIGSIRVAAYTCCWITGARRMALIGGGANRRCSRLAVAALTGIAYGAGIIVRTACSVRSRWVAAHACCGITGARRMALIWGGANYR